MTIPKIKIIIPCLLFLSSCVDPKTPETYLLPDGYQGKVTVAYGQNKGRDEEFDGGRRLYRIDTNGILITKFKSEDGTLNEEYYYEKSNGIRQKIGIDSSIFFQDTIKRKEYKIRTYKSVFVRSFGIAGGYGGGSDFPIKFDFSQSTIGSGLFIDTTDLEKCEEKQWKLIVDKLK